MGIFDSFNTGDLYGNNYGNVGDAINNFVQDNSGSNYSMIGDAINNYVNDSASSSKGFNIKGLPWNKILGTAGRLGSGLLTGAASYEAQQQPDYMFIPQYSGNGLATTRVINNRANKQNQLDQMFGAGNMLSQLFPNGFGIFGNGNSNKLDTLPTSYNITGDDIYNGNYGIVGNAINNYVRG